MLVEFRLQRFFIRISHFKCSSEPMEIGTKNVLKWNRALYFMFSMQSSIYVATL